MASGPDKTVDWPALLEMRAKLRTAGKTVVWTNGCFDLLHAGHVQSLQAARGFGDVLVVGVNSDGYLQKSKGAGRPLTPLIERLEVLNALACVDFTIAFDDDTPELALRRLQPDVHCKGMDYAPPHGKPIPEAAVVAAYGGRVEFLPMLPGTSTTELIRRIRALSPSQLAGG
jgi:rfaE bifunctional protein nucleotidyltransferase chain/domain